MLVLPSGLEVADPEQSLIACYAQEYLYYDAIPSGNPKWVKPEVVPHLVGQELSNLLLRRPALKEAH